VRHFSFVSLAERQALAVAPGFTGVAGKQGDLVSLRIAQIPDIKMWAI